MNCAMCPAWMGGGMILRAVIGVLLVIPISKQFPTFQFLRIAARPHFIEKQQRHGYTGKVRK